MNKNDRKEQSTKNAVAELSKKSRLSRCAAGAFEKQERACGDTTSSPFHTRLESTSCDLWDDGIIYRRQFKINWFKGFTTAGG